jgi:16S rRNA processing protein RimM
MTPGGVPLARVVGAHGLRGELRVQASVDNLMNLKRVSRIWLARDDGDDDQGDDERHEYEVARARAGRPGECRLTLLGVADREAAEALRGRLLLARPEDLPQLEEGEYYADELVGCKVEEVDGRPVGIVRSILETGGRDVLVIEDAAGGEQLVPAAEPLLRRVDLTARRIVIDAPAGLLDRRESGDPKEDTGEQA